MVLATVGLSALFVWGMAKLGMRVTECGKCIEEYTQVFDDIRERQLNKTITRTEALEELSVAHKRIERRYLRVSFNQERSSQWLKQMYAIHRHLIILAEV
jgi:hypothetical protein